MPAQGRPQFQPGKYEIFPGRGMSNQKASQKPTKPFFDSQKPAKPGKQRPDLARQPGPCRELRKCSLSGRPRRDRRLGCFASPHVALCHLLCFVCGRGSPCTRPPQAAGRSSQFQPGKYDIFPGRGMSNQKASQKQPEANRTSFLIARSRPNQASNLARQPGPCRELRKCSLFLDVQGEIVLRKPTRGIVPSTLLRLWEGQCLHKAAPRQPGGPASFSQVSTRFFRQGDVQPESKPEASQKPTKPLFLIARSQPNQASRGLIWQGSLAGS